MVSPMRRRLLLISNSFAHGRPYLDHCLPAIQSFLGDVKEIFFIPYALKDWERYMGLAREGFGKIGVNVVGIHEKGHSILGAEAVFVGDGNTFRLLKLLHQHDLVAQIRHEVVHGRLRYLGASAGSSVACPTIMTTNDMPIVRPPSFMGMGLVPFQINPHFLEGMLTATHGGKSREKHIAEFHEENSEMVVGLREGAWIEVTEGLATLCGTGGAMLFMRGEEPREWNESYGRITIE